MQRPNSHYKKLALASVGPLAVKICAAAIGLLFNFIVVGFVTPEAFGAFTLAQSLILFFAVLSKLGLENTLVKLVARAHAQNKSESAWQTYTLCLLMALIASLLIALSIIAFSTLLFSSLLQQDSMLPLATLIAITVIPTTINGIQAALLKAHRRPTSSLFFSGLATQSIATCLTLIVKPATADDLLWLFCSASVIALLLSLVICQAQLNIKFRLSFTPMREIRHSCLPLLSAALVAFFIQQFGTILLARYVALEDVGVFALAVKIAALMSFVLVAINAVVAPRYAALFGTHQLIQLKQLHEQTGKLLAGLALLMSVALWLSADALMGLFGDKFREGASLLRILVVGQFVNLATGSVVNLLVMTGHERLHQRNTLLVALLTGFLAFTLMPLLGTTGAALTTAIAMSVQNLLGWYFAKTRLLARISSI